MIIRLYGMTLRAARVVPVLRLLAPEARLEVVTEQPSAIEPDFTPTLQSAVTASGATFLNSSTVTPDIIDIILCVNWRRKIAVPHENTYIIHDSLLPAYRGHSPLVWAIRNGETTTGATMIRATDEIDAGPIVAQERIDITGLYIREAMERMTAAYLQLLRSTIPLLVAGHRLEARAQTGTPTYAAKIDYEHDAAIDPLWPDEKIRAHIRAFSPPYPRAYVRVGDRKVYV